MLAVHSFGFQAFPLVPCHVDHFSWVRKGSSMIMLWRLHYASN